jgi:plasmid maintenance system antidote protein VapI
MDDAIMPPVHPGEILLAEFLEPPELSQYQLARSIPVRPGESTRSCTDSAGSAPTPRSASPASSELPSGSG